MVLVPLSTRDWTDPAWDDPCPDPETNVLTISRMKNERGRGNHTVNDPVLKDFFVKLVGEIVGAMDAAEKDKIDLDNVNTTSVVKSVYVSMNQCLVSIPVLTC